MKELSDLELAFDALEKELAQLKEERLAWKSEERRLWGAIEKLTQLVLKGRTRHDSR